MATNPSRQRVTLAHADAGGGPCRTGCDLFTKELIDEGSEDEVLLAETSPAVDDVGGNFEQESEPETLPPVVVPERPNRPSDGKLTSTHKVFFFVFLREDLHCETCKVTSASSFFVVFAFFSAVLSPCLSLLKSLEVLMSLFSVQSSADRTAMYPSSLCPNKEGHMRILQNTTLASEHITCFQLHGAPKVVFRIAEKQICVAPQLFPVLHPFYRSDGTVTLTTRPSASPLLPRLRLIMYLPCKNGFWRYTSLTGYEPNLTNCQGIVAWPESQNLEEAQAAFVPNSSIPPWRRQMLSVVGIQWQSNMFTGGNRAETL